MKSENSRKPSFRQRMFFVAAALRVPLLLLKKITAFGAKFFEIILTTILVFIAAVVVGMAAIVSWPAVLLMALFYFGVWMNQEYLDSGKDTPAPFLTFIQEDVFYRKALWRSLGFLIVLTAVVASFFIASFSEMVFFMVSCVLSIGFFVGFNDKFQKEKDEKENRGRLEGEDLTSNYVTPPDVGDEHYFQIPDRENN